MNNILDEKKVYGTKHLIEFSETELLITKSKFFSKDLIREIPICDIEEISFVKVNGGNNTSRYFITRIFTGLAALVIALVSEGNTGFDLLDKDHFDIKYKYEGEQVHSVFETDLNEGDIEEMRLYIKRDIINA